MGFNDETVQQPAAPHNQQILIRYRCHYRHWSLYSKITTNTMKARATIFLEDLSGSAVVAKWGSDERDSFRLTSRNIGVERNIANIRIIVK